MWQMQLKDEAATTALGAALAGVLQAGLVIYLQGDLGVGKTTLVRGLLRQLGYQGNVRSPTYTLLESYEIHDWRVAHLDLYRIADPEELDYLELRDLLDGHWVMLFEWPERGSGFLPRADLLVMLSHDGEGRHACITATTPLGQQVLAGLPPG